MAIKIKLTELKSRFNQIENLNKEVIFTGTHEINKVAERVIMKPAGNNNNIELTFTKPGTHEMDSEILLKIRPKESGAGKKFPYHDIRITVKKTDLTKAIKIFISKYCKKED